MKVCDSGKLNYFPLPPNQTLTLSSHLRQIAFLERSRWRVSHNEWLGCKVTDRIPTAFIVILVISRHIGRHTGTKVNRQGGKS